MENTYIVSNLHVLQPKKQKQLVFFLKLDTSFLLTRWEPYIIH